MSDLRIVSFLPSATEMVCALGLIDRLVGVTHECDYPAEVTCKPLVVRSTFDVAGMSPCEIDAAVSACISSHASLYQVDERLLQELAPTLILTQDLCQVCAPSGNEITQLLKSLRSDPQILRFTPKSLADINENLRELGSATDRCKEAQQVIASGEARLEQVRALTRGARNRPRVFCMEWVDPIYCSGHWIPEMVELAGGVDELSRKGTDSARVSWQEVINWAPEVLVINPCGFDLANASHQALQLKGRDGLADLPAVLSNRVFGVDANSYFARPGPRVIDGVELLAHLIHPQLCKWSGPNRAFQRIDLANLGFY